MGDYDRTQSLDAGVADGPSKSQFRPAPSPSGSKVPLYMQSSDGKHVLVRRVRRKEDGSWKHFARWFVENQISTSTLPSIGAARNLQIAEEKISPMPCLASIAFVGIGGQVIIIGLIEFNLMLSFNIPENFF